MSKPPTPVADRFWPKVNKDGPVPPHAPHLGACWVWTASLRNGYGQVGRRAGEPNLRAHRWAYEQEHGPIPAGLVPDHLCRNRACVRPQHIELVTVTDNNRRGDGWSGRNAQRTECMNGHPFDAANTRRDANGGRECRRCDADRHRAGRAAAAARRALAGV